MSTQLVLIIVLGFLVVLLAYLLVSRLGLERRQQAAIKLMDITEFSDFLRTNSIDGKILVVAGKVSQALKTAFGCERIIFLRKQRGFLELNYYHGIYRFDRAEFRVRFTPELAERLRESFSPQPLESLESLLAPSVYKKLSDSEVNLFFPIFWRDNLYGIYFIKSSIETSTPGFGLLVANLAHSLSAAYHVKWHEARYEKLQLRLSEDESHREAGRESETSAPILRLVRHRTAEALVPRIVEAVQKELSVPRVALFYESRGSVEELQQARCGISERLDTLSRPSFNQLIKLVRPEELKSIDELGDAHAPVSSWLQGLKQSGLKYVTAFPMSSHRTGLLALGDGVQAINSNRLKRILPAAQMVLDNAESFEEMEALSFTDGLTGLANQRYFRKRLEEEIDRARRYNRSLALIVFDMDELKSVNDQYGHLAGDAVIRRMGPILRSSIRAIDIIARYGGDEFCVIMPEADIPTCERFMERLQCRIAETKFQLSDKGPDINCTISLGGAVFPNHAEGAESLFRAADLALLRAKSRGRNQHILHDVEESA